MTKRRINTHKNHAVAPARPGRVLVLLDFRVKMKNMAGKLGCLGC
jgi:hypothetical protein